MESSQWIYYSPNFESDKYNNEMMQYSPWSDHRAFAYDYVSNVRPNRIVELGSYYGCSAFTFLQAIKDHCLRSEFYAVDTWEGDSFTEHDYSEDIYGAYKKIQDNCFANQATKMLRMTFDQSREYFEEHSIDLLHIDGSHNYEDVKHDFSNWIEKVKLDGAIFFHDIGEDKLFGKRMGSSIFWNDLKKSFHTTVEFPFSFGLGILFLKEENYRKFISAVDMNYYQRKANISAVKYKDALRKDFFRMMSLQKNIVSLESQNEIQREHLYRYKDDTQKKEIYISELEKKVTALTEQCEQLFHTTKENYRKYCSNEADYQHSLSEKEGYIEELKTTIAKYAHSVSEKDKYIEELRIVIAKYDSTVNEKDKYIEELKATITKYECSVSEKDKYIDELRATITKYECNASEKDNYIEELKIAITKYDSTVYEKDKYIDHLTAAVHNLNHELDIKNSKIEELSEECVNLSLDIQRILQENEATISSYQKTVDGKDKYIEEIENTLLSYESNVTGKDTYISELKEAIKKYDITIEGKERYIKELLETISGYQQTVAGKDDYIEELDRNFSNLQLEIQSCGEYVSELMSYLHDCRNEITVTERQIEDYERDILKAKQDEIDALLYIDNLRARNKELIEMIRSIPLGKYILKRMDKDGG